MCPRSLHSISFFHCLSSDVLGNCWNQREDGSIEKRLDYWSWFYECLIGTLVFPLAFALFQALFLSLSLLCSLLLSMSYLLSFLIPSLSPYLLSYTEENILTLSHFFLLHVTVFCTVRGPKTEKPNKETETSAYLRPNKISNWTLVLLIVVERVHLSSQ